MQKNLVRFVNRKRLFFPRFFYISVYILHYTIQVVVVFLSIDARPGAITINAARQKHAQEETP